MAFNISEEMLENQAIQALVEENKSLKALLTKWKPEIEIEYDSISGEMTATIVQNGFSAQYKLNEVEVKNLDSPNKVHAFTESLINDIYFAMIRDMITPRIESLEANREQLKNVGKW